MTAYYNEHDPFAAQWLKNLIIAGLIAPGDVDERSIDDVHPNDLKNYKQCHFFAGVGVWSYALRNAGWGDDEPVWTGSCPCQPFSEAGKGFGFNDERHLWPSFFHLIECLRPSIIFGEQVASNDGLQWLDLVFNDLEGADYTAAAADLCAASVNAPHIRQRLFWMAYTLRERLPRRREHVIKRPMSFNVGTEGVVSRMGESDSDRREKRGETATVMGQRRSANATSGASSFWNDCDWVYCRDEKFRPIESGSFPLVNGTPAHVGRIRAYGNAIVAPLAETFIKAAMECIP